MILKVNENGTWKYYEGQRIELCGAGKGIGEDKSKKHHAFVFRQDGTFDDLLFDGAAYILEHGKTVDRISAVYEPAKGTIE